MTENSMKIIKTSKKYWLSDVIALLVFLVILSIIGLALRIEVYFEISIVAIVIGIPTIFMMLKRALSNQVIFYKNRIEGKIDRGNFNICWGDIGAVQIHDQETRKFIILHTNETAVYIPYRYFDENEVLEELKRYVPLEKFEKGSLQNLPKYRDWQISSSKEFSGLTENLKVTQSGFEKWLGFASLAFGIFMAVISYNNSDPMGMICSGTLFGGCGIVLIFLTLGSIEANNQEISLKLPYRHVSMYWEEIREIYTNTNQGVVALVSENGRLMVKPSGWSGKDKDQLYRLLQFKIEKSGVVPKESQKILFWMSKN